MPAKVTTMVQEVIRRLRNMSKQVPKEEINGELGRFSEKMKRSGYGEKTRKMVLVAGIKGFERMRNEDEAGIRKMYRKHEDGEQMRWARKLGGKSSWFKGRQGKKQEGEEGTIQKIVGAIEKKAKSKGSGVPLTDFEKKKKRDERDEAKEVKKEEEWEKEPEAVIFIAYTPNGELRKRLQREEDGLAKTLGTRRVKFVERGGKSLQSLLCNSNPWAKKHCGSVCPICDSGDLGKCRSESVVYEIRCSLCEKRGKRKVYLGETGKSGWERGEQHWRGWRKKEKNSCLWKHNINDHDGKLGEEEEGCKMKILSKPRRALQRQVEEAIRILEEEPRALMNSKSGYGNNKIPRISVMMGDEEVTRRKDR